MDNDYFTVGLSARPEDIENAKTITLIESYLEYNTVSILYGDSGSGKSMLTLSVCVYLLDYDLIESVNYYDFDNGKTDQKNRGIHDLLRKYESKFNYINLDTLDNANLTPTQVLNGLLESQIKGSMPYEKQFFVFDTMGELAEGSLGKDEVMRPLLDKFKKLRSMGATVQTIHHTTKSKEDVTFFGSNYIKIKIDALWHLTAKETAIKNKMEFALKCDKNRSGNLKDTAFIINPKYHSLSTGDYVLASISETERDFIEDVTLVLTGTAFTDQSALLEEIGKSPKDKTAIKLLRKYDGKKWKREEVNSFPKTVRYSTLTEVYETVETSETV